MLAIGVTSYDGEVFFGLTADRDAISDLDMLAQCLLDALEELCVTQRPSDECVSPHARRPRRPARRCEEGSSAAGGSA